MNQVVRCLSLVIGRGSRGIQYVEAYMTFNHLRHQRIHRTSTGGDVVQYIRALRLLIQRPFNSIHLTPDSPYTVQQFLLLFDCVSHKKVFSRLYKYTPAGIS